jgi:hypothetical protein
MAATAGALRMVEADGAPLVPGADKQQLSKTFLQQS